MSNPAINWAGALRGIRSPMKFVLFALANFANSETWRSFPTIETIHLFTGLNRKTIIVSIMGLKKLGHIMDTGERVGRTRQVPVYEVNPGRVQVTSNTNDATNGTVPKQEVFRSPNSISPKSFEKSSGIALKQSQNRDTEPLSNLHKTNNNPISGLQIASEERWFVPTNETDCKLSEIAPEWDKNCLYQKFNDYFGNQQKTKNPQAAFLGWARAFTNRQPPTQGENR